MMNLFDLRKWFNDQGIEPLYPEHNCWTDINYLIQKDNSTHKLIDSSKICMCEVLKLMRLYNDANNTRQFQPGLSISSMPIVESYLRLSIALNEELPSVFTDDQHTVFSHPLVVKSLINRLSTLGAYQYNEIVMVSRLLKQSNTLTKANELIIEKHIQELLMSNELEGAVLLSLCIKSPIYYETLVHSKVISLLNMRYPLMSTETMAYKNKQTWHTQVSRIEPILASWLDDTSHTVTELSTAIYNYFDFIDFRLSDLYTAWLYLGCCDFLNKLDLEESQNKALCNFISLKFEAIDGALKKWDTYLEFVKNIYISPLSQAHALHCISNDTTL